MKIAVQYTLTGQAPVTVLCGPRAIATVEKTYNIKVAKDGLGIEQLGHVAWFQAVSDGAYHGPWTEFWGAVDDLDVVPAPDPTGAGPAAPPAPS